VCTGGRKAEGGCNKESKVGYKKDEVLNAVEEKI
jgi:hypothetical protein